MFLETTLLLWFVKGDSKKAKGLKRFSNYVDSKKVDKIEHEWQQSTVEARYYIDALTVEGEIVFDPFMGSGTTGIAALKAQKEIHRDGNRQSTLFKCSSEVKQIYRYTLDISKWAGTTR